LCLNYCDATPEDAVQILQTPEFESCTCATKADKRCGRAIAMLLMRRPDGISTLVVLVEFMDFTFLGTARETVTSVGVEPEGSLQQKLLGIGICHRRRQAHGPNPDLLPATADRESWRLAAHLGLN
jgi:hypothetical protein